MRNATSLAVCTVLLAARPAVMLLASDPCALQTLTCVCGLAGMDGKINENADVAMT
jgi:hypothetical protein